MLIRWLGGFWGSNNNSTKILKLFFMRIGPILVSISREAKGSHKVAIERIQRQPHMLFQERKEKRKREKEKEGLGFSSCAILESFQARGGNRVKLLINDSGQF